MKRLYVAAALLSFGLATSASAGISVSIAKGNDGTFNNNPVGSYTGYSAAIYDGAVGPIEFVAGADTTGVSIGTTGYDAEPGGDVSNYLWGLRNGTTVYFGTQADPRQVHSFLIHWGSVDSLGVAGYNNLLTLSNGDTLTGDDLVGLGFALGNGSQTDPANNRWLQISDTTAFSSFTATSPLNAFEFDMSVPEPASWAMMLVGFGVLGMATRRQRRMQTVIA